MATLFPAQNTFNAVLIINSATAVPRQFYHRFARFFAARGYEVLTYDYRGIGESSPDNLRYWKASLLDWAEEDMGGLLDYAHTTYPGEKIFMVGHSIGGQLFGMIPDPGRLAGVIGVCAQSGYWKLQKGLEPIKIWLIMNTLWPVLVRVLGYFPWSRLGGSEDLPGYMAMQWRSWSMHPEYLFGVVEDSRLSGYDSFDVPMLSLSFEDDPWGSEEAVDKMVSYFKNAPSMRRHINPQEKGIKKIGHFGFFKQPGAVLWPDIMQWMQSCK